MNTTNKTCKNNASNLLSHFIKANPLNTKFFSKENLDFLQEKIKCNVLKQIKQKISRQSDEQLTIVMRSIYLQYGKNQPDNIDQQVDELNKKVIMAVMPQIISAIKQHIKYVESIDSNGRQKNNLPMRHPKNVSSAGTKSLSMFRPL